MGACIFLQLCFTFYEKRQISICPTDFLYSAFYSGSQYDFQHIIECIEWSLSRFVFSAHSETSSVPIKVACVLCGFQPYKWNLFFEWHFNDPLSVGGMQAKCFLLFPVLSENHLHDDYLQSNWSEMCICKKLISNSLWTLKLLSVRFLLRSLILFIDVLEAIPL